MKSFFYALCMILIAGYVAASSQDNDRPYGLTERSMKKMTNESKDLFNSYMSKDTKRVYKLTRSLARKGYPLSRCFSDGMYKEGSVIKKDREKAMECYHRAAAEGDGLGQSILGELYSNTISGDPQEAAKWYEMAAKQGNAQAQLQLASMYEGGIGVEINWEEAAKWYERAADKGLSNAQFPMCKFYYQGKGVEKNYVKSYFWCDLALNSTYFYRKTEAAMYIDSLLPEVMSPSDIQKASEMANEWRESHNNSNITEDVFMPMVQMIHKGFINFLK